MNIKALARSCRDAVFPPLIVFPRFIASKWISNVGFGLVCITEFKLQAFNSEIGSLKKKISKKKFQTMKLKYTFLVL